MATKNETSPEKGIKQCPVGTVLFREGEKGDRMYVIKSGQVRLTKRISDTQITIEDLGAGEFCGEIALVNAQPRTVTATALSEITVIPIESSQFENMMRSNADIALRMLKKMSERLTKAQYRISNLTLRTNRARLMHQLYQEATQSAQAKGNTIHHPTALPNNLADILSLEFGEIKQLLNQLIHDELIAIDHNGYFQILDEVAYERYMRYLELHDRFEYRHSS